MNNHLQREKERPPPGFDASDAENQVKVQGDLNRSPRRFQQDSMKN